jgi:hypothetical protein
LRARRRSEAEWQVHIRDGVRALIDALVLCARGLTPKDEAGWRGAARKLAGDAAAGFKFTSKGTYGKLFDMGGSTNSHQYLGPNARRRITDNHLEKIAAFLGALFPSLVVVDAQGPDAWVKWLDRANQAVGGVGGLAQEPTAAVVAEVQRRAVRASLQDKVIAGLEELGRVAIVGMSGTGKTVLARQVLADWCEPENPAITIDALGSLQRARIRIPESAGCGGRSEHPQWRYCPRDRGPSAGNYALLRRSRVVREPKECATGCVPDPKRRSRAAGTPSPDRIH